MSRDTPTEFGDVFARCWDGMETHFVCSSTGTALLDDRMWWEEVQSLATSLAEKGTVSADVLDGALADQGDRLKLLVALDRVLAPASPRWGCPVPQELIPVRKYWGKTGKLSSDDVLGAVLFRYVEPQRPASAVELDTLFKAVVRVDEQGWLSIAHRRISTKWDLSAFRASEGIVRVAVCPFTNDMDDFDIHRGPHENRPAYRLEGRDSERLRKRIHDLIPLLDQSGVEIAVLPEGVLSPSLLKTWTDELRSTYAARPRDSPLRWLLVGTGPTKDGSTRNTAVVLHRCGRELTQQDKRYPFTFTKNQVHDWGLSRWVEPGSQEDIERGSQRTVLESVIGRVAITICEDLSRPDTFEGGLRQVGVSLLLVPVFNMPFAKQNWAQRNAEDMLLHVGSRTLVINSLAVASLHPQLTPSFALAFSRTEEPGEWPVHCDSFEGTSPLAVKVFELDLGTLGMSTQTDPMRR